MPQYYFVSSDGIKDEKAHKGSQYRTVSQVGSTSSNIFLWGQAMLIISDLLTSHLLLIHELDPLRRYLPSATRPKAAGRYSTFEVSFVKNICRFFCRILYYYNFHIDYCTKGVQLCWFWWCFLKLLQLNDGRPSSSGLAGGHTIPF
jgi:hypothetical protein